MLPQKVLGVVQKGVAYVPAPVRKFMRNPVVMGGCVVIGGALTAYGQNECTGTEAIAGVGIGAGVLLARKIPVAKLVGFVIGRK